MSSWTVTWGIIQAIALMAIVGLIINWGWLWRDLHWFEVITATIVVGGLLLVLVLTLDDLGGLQ